MDDDSQAPAAALQVIALCAAWCGVCREWRPVFEQSARAHPEWKFAWVDVEDEDEAMGGVDITTFPSLLVARGRDALFCGPLAPTQGALERLVTGLAAQPQPLNGAEAALFARLLPQVLPRNAI